ncbi:unnamed protein product [Linum trigynum]|uniref:Uncharacterized protein n=1 Tax=Linum trigynum TaxID=586398 RepID=A0AAV2CHI6_9ROSI
MTYTAFDDLGVNEHLRLLNFIGGQKLDHDINVLLSGNLSAHLMELFKHRSRTDLHFIKIATDVTYTLFDLFRVTIPPQPKREPLECHLQ